MTNLNIIRDLKNKINHNQKQDHSLSWLERTLDRGEVGGSRPPGPTIF